MMSIEWKNILEIHIYCKSQYKKHSFFVFEFEEKKSKHTLRREIESTVIY